ncbi:MAG TPA: ABC transporter permease [Acidimicrobiales bacterium]
MTEPAMPSAADIEQMDEAQHSAPAEAHGAPVPEQPNDPRFADYLGPVVVFVLFIGGWYLTRALMSEQRQFLMPPPWRPGDHNDVVDTAFLDWSNLKPILEATWQSAKVAGVGLAIAIFIGVALATIMSQASWIEKSMYPYLVALQAVPILAIVPLIGMLLDFGFAARVFVCVLISLFPIVSSTLFGLLSADRLQHELFTLQGATRVTRLRKLQFPAALPAIFTGFRISAGLSVIGAIVGDFFFQQGQRGLGQIINLYRARLQMEQMYGALIIACVLGIVVFWLFGFLSRLAVGKWYEPTRSP